MKKLIALVLSVLCLVSLCSSLKALYGWPRTTD